MTIHLSRSRKLANRRLWAQHILRIHVDDAGTCDFCVSTYGAEHPWPCVPARIALLYIGQPQQLSQEATAGDLTS